MQQIKADLEREIGWEELQAVKFKTETRLKLLSKILPDMKELELTGPEGGALQIESITRTIIDPMQ